MGGHSAWKKRVLAGGLAKKRGGAIARHRPRLGRKGKDLALNRKGNIGGGNPKKMKKKNKKNQKEADTDTIVSTKSQAGAAPRTEPTSEEKTDTPQAITEKSNDPVMGNLDRK